MKVITNQFYLSLTLVFTAFCTSIYAQQTAQYSIGTINRPTPKFGFNGTGIIPPKPNPNTSLNLIGANWPQKAFIDSVAMLVPEIIRFPGGLNSISLGLENWMVIYSHP